MSATTVARRPTTRQDDRLAKGRELFLSGAVQPLPTDHFVYKAWVSSQSRPGCRFLVCLGPQSCTCPDYQRHGFPHLCKHIVAARLAFLAEIDAEVVAQAA